MPGWHVDNEAFQLSSGHPLEGICHDGVVPTVYKRRPDVLDEGEEPIFALLLVFQGFQLGQLG